MYPGLQYLAITQRECCMDTTLHLIEEPFALQIKKEITPTFQIFIWISPLSFSLHHPTPQSLEIKTSSFSEHNSISFLFVIFSGCNILEVHLSNYLKKFVFLKKKYSIVMHVLFFSTSGMLHNNFMATTTGFYNHYKFA